jgi:hypothetical protein
MQPFRHPRRWALAGLVAMLAVAAWLLLVPITAVYLTGEDDPAPRQVESRYSWWTPEQNLLYSDAGMTQHAHLVNGVRLDCGSVLRVGPHVAALAPAGPQACAALQSPRYIVALSLLALGLFGVLGAKVVAAESRLARTRYSQSYRQRRALRRGRR